jgi:hypothetical protein
MMEKFTTGGITTLDGAISDSQTTLVVTSATPFPTAGVFRIKIDSEIMKVTGVSGTTFTIVRGQEGTTGATHSDDADVKEVMTAASLQAILDDTVTVCAVADLPSTPGRAGRSIHLTDGKGLIAVARDASNWDYWWGSFGPYKGMVLSDFSDHNTTGSDDHLSQDGPIVTWWNEATTPGGENIRLRMQNIPGGYTTWTVKCSYIHHPSANDSYNTLALALRNSSSGSILQFGMAPRADADMLTIAYWHSSPTNFSEYLCGKRDRNPMVGHFKIYFDGTTYFCYHSQNRQDWQLKVKFTKAGRMETCDQFGIACNPYNVMTDFAMCRAWFFECFVENGQT